MSCVLNELGVPKGSSKTFALSVEDAQGAPVDLTGAKVWFCVRKQPGCAPLITKANDLGGGSLAEIEVVDPVNGKANIYLSPSDTDRAPAEPDLLEIGKYLYDVWVELATGKRYQVVPPSVINVTQRICEVGP